ncbi:MAG: hypothetical protein QOD97_1689 [Mycobacterium sp.]|nr:hypothetical protein [Mycobacterium sp.]
MPSRPSCTRFHANSTGTLLAVPPTMIGLTTRLSMKAATCHSRAATTGPIPILRNGSACSCSVARSTAAAEHADQRLVAEFRVQFGQ